MKAHRAVLCCLVVAMALLAGGLALRPSGPSAALAYALPSEPPENQHVLPMAATALQPLPHPILGDVSVRKAIAYCTNKDDLLTAYLASLDPPLTLTPEEREALLVDSFILKSSWAYAEPATTYPFSPSTGQALLETAGWTLPADGQIRTKDGKQLVLTLTTTESAQRVAFLTVFAAQMQACGIDVIRYHVPDAFDRIFWRDFELAEYAWAEDENEPGGVERYACDQIPSPDNNWIGLNAMGWCNSAASDAIVLASDTTLSQTERRAYYETFVNLFAEDVPSLPLFLRPNSTAWEHIDFNFETFLQQVDATSEEGAVLAFEHYGAFASSGTVVVPPDAVTQTTAIGFYPLVRSFNAIPDAFRDVNAFRLTASVGGIPLEGFMPEVPITVTIDYPPVIGMRCNGCVDEATLRLYRWDGAAWSDAVLTCPESQRYWHLDLDNNHLEATVCRFSEFILMGEARYWVYLPSVLR
jgi:peptide/nickel transport system substrate-binding protein